MSADQLPADTPKRKRSTRRKTTGAISAAQVEGLFTRGFSVIATLRRKPHWQLQPGEIESCSEDIAAALNMIPASYADKAMQGSTVVAAIAGVGAIVGQRVAIDKMHAALAAEQRRIREQAATESDTIETAPEPEPERPNTSARVPRGTLPNVGEGW